MSTVDDRLFTRVAARRLGDEVYQHLLEAIASNRLEQGARIQEDVLAAQMGVSKTPVREALRRLEAEGFMRLDPHQTPVVRALGARDIEELYHVRESLERLAVRALSERALADSRPSAILEQIEACQTDAEARWTQGLPIDVGDSVEYNRRFHELIFAGSGNQRLRRLYQVIAVDVRRLSYRSIQVAGRQRQAVSQHRAILEAIGAGDAQEAEHLVIAHIQQARDDLVREARQAHAG